MKRVLIVSLGVLVLAAAVCLAGLGIYYSNMIVFPSRHTLSDIPQDWGVNERTLEEYGLEYEDVSFRTKDNIVLKG
ncbi:unnamed protein product, partial [marine sediment metagenome]